MISRSNPCLLSSIRKCLFTLLALLLLSFQLPTQAASFGRLTLYSNIGEPLRAEIAIISPPEKIHSLLVELGSREDFKNAGIEYSPELRHLHMSLSNNQAGQTVVRLSSNRVLTSPTLSFLLELRWAGGRQLREFTFSLQPDDKPVAGISPQSAITGIVSAPEVPRLATPVVEQSPLLGTAVPEDFGNPATATVVSTESREKPGKPSVQSSKTKMASKTSKARQTGRKIKRGETLYRIALENKPPHVTLDQMLLALYQSNPHAFLGENINRLQTGVILEMPDETTLAETKKQHVKKIITGHHQAWNQYRRTLSSRTVESAQVDETRLAVGKIIARVEDDLPPTEKSLDLVVVSASPQNTDEIAQAQEIAKQKERQEASERIAALEKNINLLKKLEETKKGISGIASNAASNVAEGVTAPTPAPPPAEAYTESRSFYFWLGLLALFTTIGFGLLWKQTQSLRNRNQYKE